MPVFCNQIQRVKVGKHCSTKHQMQAAEILQLNIINVNSATDVSLSSPPSCQSTRLGIWMWWELFLSKAIPLDRKELFLADGEGCDEFVNRKHSSCILQFWSLQLDFLRQLV